MSDTSNLKLPKFCSIPAGTGTIGSTDFAASQPVHEVHFEAFELASTPVTNEQYAQFVEETGHRPPLYVGEADFNRPNQPVVGVSWDDAQAFVAWLNEKDPEYEYSLPSEAQWEYACRAGTTTEYYSGDGEDALKKIGWYYGNSNGRLHDVAELEPNAHGLFDMIGNVWEWCEDSWHATYHNAPSDGRAWRD
jgi:formylglycine-generating enzyme required for sulfatase activity